MMLLLNTLIVKRVATVLGLAVLPSGSVLSVRALTASEEGLTIFPVLGAFGTVLSGFQPGAPVAVVQLATLDVLPASIGTGDPTKNAAQGRVQLDAPAPAGGITVVLSSDRSDVVVIDRPTLLIAEGLQKGNFTITGIPQALALLAHVDVTVQASLGTQTLKAPLSIRPENPTTAVPAPATPVVPPASPLELSVQPATATFAETPTANFIVAPRDVTLSVQMYFTCAALFGAPVPLRAALIPPGITTYAVPIPLAQLQESLLKNGFSPPADLTIIAVADGVSKNAVLRIMPA
jgi:hypothetical protein